MFMNSRKTAAILAVLALSAVGGLSADQPPTDLHEVDGHWTA